MYAGYHTSLPPVPKLCDKCKKPFENNEEWVNLYADMDIIQIAILEKRFFPKWLQVSFLLEKWNVKFDYFFILGIKCLVKYNSKLSRNSTMV